MERGYVRGFDAVAKAELWERWRRGELLKAIGRAFGKPSSSIYLSGAQAINFLILVWLLKRFLYKPILRDRRTRERDRQPARGCRGEEG